MKRLALILAVVAVGLTASAPAYGQSPVGDAYGGEGGGVLGAVTGGGGPGAGQKPEQAEAPAAAPAPAPAPVAAPAPAPQVQVAATEGGALPFTGLDLGVLALGGVVLVGVGVGLRRFARPLS